MKNTQILFLLLSSLFFISCGDDEVEDANNDVAVNGTITFDGDKYSIASGVLNLSSVTSGTEGVFFLADGTVSNSGSSSDSQIIIAITAVSEDTSTLESGSYEVNRLVTSKYALVAVSTANVSNLRSIVGGTIAITGSGNSYSLTFNDVSFGQGITLTGSVSGTFGN